MSSGYIATLHSRHFGNKCKGFMIILLDTSKRFEASFVKKRFAAIFVSYVSHSCLLSCIVPQWAQSLSREGETDNERQQIHSSSPNRMFRKMLSL
jgi:hypothetical protein